MQWLIYELVQVPTLIALIEHPSGHHVIELIQQHDGAARKLIFQIVLAHAADFAAHETASFIVKQALRYSDSEMLIAFGHVLVREIAMNPSAFPWYPVMYVLEALLFSLKCEPLATQIIGDWVKINSSMLLWSRPGKRLVQAFSQIANRCHYQC